jgi:flagellar basal-body rod protein FlgG
MFAAISGLKQHQVMLDVTANDIANVNTIGYKSARVTFADSLTQMQRGASGSTTATGGSNAAQVGLGVGLGSIDNLMGAGALQTTGNSLDVAIQGEGFFEVTRPDGTKGYTRAGNFTTNAQGKLTTADGNAVSPGITIPSNASDITITAAGVINGTVAGKSTKLGQLGVVTFQNPYGLTSAGNNLYDVSAASGTPRTGTPGQKGMGSVTQGALEMSNVNSVDEMVGMVSTQRAYEAVSKVISASDEMLGQANQLRRG